jgi:hypothetical protein
VAKTPHMEVDSPDSHHDDGELSVFQLHLPIDLLLVSLCFKLLPEPNCLIPAIFSCTVLRFKLKSPFLVSTNNISSLCHMMN